ncbi:acyl-protein synthetase [Flavonifractor plautii]|nr:acyl-protein synthetase [Flavonifractor plautii]
MSYPPFVCRPADETYEHAWEYVWRGHRLRAVALPGHTPGSAGIFLDGDTFFSGDYLIPGRRSSSACPAGARRTTAPSRSPFSGAAPGLRICPGHGSPIFSQERSEAGVELNTLLQYKPYSTARTEKRALYAGLLTGLTQFHRERCPEYGRLLDALGCPAHMECTVESTPMMPVSLFKELELRSIPEERCSRPLPPPAPPGSGCPGSSWTGPPPPASSRPSARSCPTSWGSGGCPSWCWTAGRFCATAPCSPPGGGHSGLFYLRHQALLCPGRAHGAGSGRGAGLPGGAPGETIFLFGFTFIIWKHVVRALEERGRGWTSPTASWFTAAAGRSWPERRCPREFKARVAAATGVERVSNYYGMAEQTGCIYMECPQGHLHASLWSDIVVRRGRDYRPCEPGEEGVLQVLSPLPRSYPGHSLLTEDLGVLLGRTTAPAGARASISR